MSRFSVDRAMMFISGSEYADLAVGFEYTSNIGLPEYSTITLKIEPFRTDLATLPWWVTWWLKKLGKHNLPSIVHDYMLQHRELFPDYTRKMIDQVWREALIDQGVSKRKCQALCKGVRLNSWWREERFL